MSNSASPPAELGVYLRLIKLFGAEGRQNHVAAAVIRRQSGKRGKPERKKGRNRQRRSGADNVIEMENVDGSADAKKKHDEDAHQSGAATLIVRLTLSEVQSQRCVQRQPLR